MSLFHIYTEGNQAADYLTKNRKYHNWEEKNKADLIIFPQD